MATLATVAGCSHISVCIAGANTTGQRAVSSVLVSRSSAMPVRGLGEQVGGGRRDHDQVGVLAEAHVRHLVARRPRRRSATGWPDSAAQVGAPTNRSADAVGTTRTWCPDSVKQPQQLTGLVGGDAAA